MSIFKILAALLDYPTETTQADLPEIRLLLAAETCLPGEHIRALTGLIDSKVQGDLLDWQAIWVDQFDRTRSLSLNLFEHVHGESRDRGQAMVDLRAMYLSHGLELSVGELPDYLPIFLEFLSMVGAEEAAGLLGDASHVIGALADRLENRGSAYACVMAAVALLAGAERNLGSGQVATPDVDESMDEAWVEEPVDFGPSDVPPCAAGGSSVRMGV